MKLRKIFKITFAVISTIIFLSALAVFPVVFFFPKSKILTYLTEYSEKTLERKVEIEDLRYGLGGVTVRNVVLHDSIEQSSPVILKAEKADLRFSLIPLLHKKIELKKLTFDGLSVSIEYADEKYNIQRLIEKFTNKSGPSTIKTTIPDISLKNSTLALKSVEAPFFSATGTYEVEGDISFDGDIIKIDATRIKLPAGRGELSGELQIDRKVKESSYATGNIVLKNISLAWLYKIKEISLPFDKVSGELNDFSFANKTASASVDIASKLSTGSTLEVSGKADVKLLSPKTVSVSSADVKLASSNARLNNLFIDLSSKSFSFDVAKCEVKLQEVLPLIPRAPKKVDGEYNGSLSMKNGKLSATGKLSNASFHKDKNFIHGINTPIEIRDNSFSAENINANILGSPARISVASYGSNFDSFGVNISTETINLDELLKIKSSLSEKSVAAGSPDSAAKPLSVKGSVQIKSLKFSEYTASDATASFNYSGNALSIPSAKLKFLDGDFAGNGSVVNIGNKPTAKFHLQFSNLRVQNLGNINKNLENRIYGFAKGRAEISVSLSAEDPLKAISGKGEFAIDKGKIVNTGLQNSLGFILDPLKYKLKDLEFNTIYGNVSVDGTRYEIASLIFNSRDIRLSIKGNVEKSLSGNLDMKLEFNNDFIADIPNLTYTVLNKFKSGKWFSIPIRAKGSDITNKNNIKIIE